MGRGRSNNGSGTIVHHKNRAKEYQIIFTVNGKWKSGGYYETRAEAASALRDYTTVLPNYLGILTFSSPTSCPGKKVK